MAQPLRARFTAKNKELNGPQRGRQRLGGTPGDREDSGKGKVESPTSQTRRESEVQN